MVTPIITAILTGLATAGFIGLTTQQTASGATQVLSEGKQILELPKETNARDIPLTSVGTSLNRVLTSDSSKPSAPNIRTLNNIPNNRLFSLTLVPNANFKNFGAFEIQVNGATIVAGDGSVLTDIDGLAIPLPDSGLLLAKGSTIDVFLWSTSGTVGATVLVLTGVK